MRAASAVRPLVAMLDDPLPPHVIAHIVRPASAAIAPTIVLSRASVTPQAFGTARIALVRDIMVHPLPGVERTIDLYDDNSVVEADGTRHQIHHFENVTGRYKLRRVVKRIRLAVVLALFAVAPVAESGGKRVHVLRWPR